jgi:paired amphipathic helix protein Sin3a
LIAEAELRKREQENTRDALVDATSWRSRVQFEFNFSDKTVLRDSIKLVLSYLDRLSALGSSDRHRIEKQLQDVLPLMFMIDKDEFNQDFGFGEANPDESVDGDSADEASNVDEDESASASAARKSKKGPVAADLRMKLLKQVGEKEGRGRGSTQTPGPDDAGDDRMSVEGTPMTDNGDRADTPLPLPADPAAVAEAVEKDRAGAEASEQTWTNIEAPSQTASAAPSEAGELPRPQRKANFFTNANFYVLIRLIQVCPSLSCHVMSC